MKTISETELEELMTIPSGPCVSLYLPTHPGAGSDQDPIRLKNLLSEAEDRLTEGGMRSPEASELLQPARALLKDRDFWQHQSQGLAIFLSESLQLVKRLPESFEPLAVTGSRFHLKPLVSLLTGDGRFYVLALSRQEVRLLRGTRDSAAEITPSEMPDSLAQALRFDDPERHLQYHTGTAPSAGRRSAVYHGHGEGAEDEREYERLKQYFRKVDEALLSVGTVSRAPLVLAGVDYLLPLYREVTAHPHVIEDGIEGNPEQLDVEELHARAWEKVEPIFEKPLARAKSSYHERVGTGLASDELEVVLPAAHDGRVESMLVAGSEQIWGDFDAETREIELHERPRMESQDLLDLAAIWAIRRGGDVFVLAAQDVPGRSALAAVFRYAAPTTRAEQGADAGA